MTATKYAMTLFAGAFILLYYALLNNFPIITGDTGTYISSGFTLDPPIDRPIFYGLFIRITSLGASLWLTMLVQNLILCYVLLEFIRKAIPGISYLHSLSAIVFVTFFTIGAWYSGQLMPDIFVAITILVVVLLFCFQQTKKELILLLIILCVSVLTHNSNYVLISLFSLLVLALQLFIKSLQRFRRKCLLLIGVGVLCWTSLCTSNWLAGKGFKASNSTHVFIMGKLVESGVLKIYLEKACPIREYKICHYKDNLPVVAWEFHWDAKSPVQQTGGWEANKEEYDTIISDILSRPKYYPLLIYKSLEATARQLVLTQIDGTYILPWVIYDEETPPFKAVEKYFPHELNQLKNAKMNTKTLSINFYDNVFSLTLVVASLVFLFGYHKIENKHKLLVILFVFLVLLFLNSFITAVLSSVNSRFNSRIIWILPYVVYIYTLKYLMYEKISVHNHHFK